ncbi:fibronectin type III domain-containing protein [Nonomuraea sp. NPDC051941]|uniref:fibronectin type III domain-containing protein n=1 Tax=Nonomuraea sp. NPDC051941 TaxID=3364373 RepID=UPI0037C6A141
MPTIVEGFESATAVVPRTGNWARATDQKFSGSWSLKSATISDNGTTSCVMTVPAGAKTISFRVKVSTEGSDANPYDPFIFLIGSTETYKKAGEVDWHMPGTYALGNATQVTFRYTRDGSQPGGSNAVWIDDVVFVVDTGAPTVPAGLRVTSYSHTEISVAWQPSTDDNAVTGYGIYVGGVKRGGDVTGTFANITGLAASTSYSITVDAVDAVGNRSAVSSAVVQQTAAPPAAGALTRTFPNLTAGRTYLVEVDAVDGTGSRSARASLQVSTDSEPPTVPPNLRVTAVAGTQISVAWDPSTDAVTGVAGYGVYLDGAQAAATHPGLGWTFNGLTPGQNYLIEVDAVDGAGLRSARAHLTVQAEVDTSPPSVPPNLRVAGQSPYTLTIAWDPASDNIGVAGYGIYRDGAKIGNDQTALTYAFTGLQPEGTYQVAVDAVDASGNRSGLAQLTHVLPADLPPAPPSNLRITAVSYTSFAVAWDPAVDDVQVTGYDVTVNGQVVATNAAVLSHSMAGLPDDTAYVVRVWAVDHIGQRSTVPTELTVTTLNDYDPTPPAFTAAAGEDSISVAWEASTDDFAVTGYEISVDGQVVHSTPGTDYTVDGVRERQHLITGLTAGRTYGVRVTAVDTIGQRSLDNTQLITTTALPYSPIATPVYRLAGWAGNVRDSWGVDWVVATAEGWSSSPPVSPVSADRGGVDGVWDGAGRYGPRPIALGGVAIAPTRSAMLAAKQRIASVIFPRQQAMLRVEDARMTRQARVRLDGNIETSDQGSLVFAWRIPLKAADPRRYATVATRAAAVVSSLPGEASMTVTLEGTYRKIPARLRLFGPIRDWTIEHAESGTLMRAKPGSFVPADPAYSYLVDLGARQVWAHVPPEVWPVPRPGRSALAHRPAWWTLIPGPNTITLSGQPVAGQPGTPRLILEAYDAWA